MKLIDKDALENILRRLWKEDDGKNSEHRICYNKALQEVQCEIDSLEVKEVDLEKHLKEEIEDVFFDLDGVAVVGATHYLTVKDVKDIAKHFFSLGLQAKGE